MFLFFFFFFFKQKTAYEMSIGDWSSDVCSSDLRRRSRRNVAKRFGPESQLWKTPLGLGIVFVLEGKTPQAAQNLERAVDLLPEWPGSYSTLGVFYYQTGQVDKAREVLNRFKGSNAGGLDVNRIEQALASAPATSSSLGEPISVAARQQLLLLALSIADRTL